MLIIVILILLFSAFGCAGMETEEVIEAVAVEVAEAAPIVASSPNTVGVLTGIVSIIAGLAGAGLGVKAGKDHVKRKVSEGVVGNHAAKKVDSL